jgi:hypothetical protein
VPTRFDWRQRFAVPKSDMNANQMNGLYPIIRRVRRPLVGPDGRPVDWSTDAKPADAPKRAKVDDSSTNGSEDDEKKREEAKQS